MAGFRTDVLTLCFILEEAVDLGYGTIESNDSVAMIRCIEDQVLAHDSQANETEITTRFSVRRADIDAGETRTKVSMARQQVDFLETASESSTERVRTGM